MYTKIRKLKNGKKREMTNKTSIFGATGFIGDAYCNMYSDDVIPIDRNSLNAKSNNILYFISTIHNYNVFSNPYLDIETNLTHLLRVLENLDKNKDLTFNFISSWFVYGETKKLPAKENEYCNPKGFYSITKRCAEQLLISYCETHKINYRILRLCNVYGLGDSKFSIKRNALQYLINEVVNGRDINLYNGGEDTRDFLFVKDVCRAIRICAESEIKNSIVNIGSGKSRKFIDIMNYVKKKVNSSSSFNPVKPPEFHKIVQTDNMYLDVSKLRNLGFSEKYNFWDNIDILINQNKNLGEK